MPKAFCLLVRAASLQFLEGLGFMAPKISSWVIPTELSDAKLDINSGESGNLTFRATFSDLNDDATPRFDSFFLFLTWKEATSGATELLSIFKDKLANGEISGVLDMRFAKPGNWSISNASMTYSDISYDETHSNSLTEADNFKAAGIDLSKLSFTVVNKNPDTVPPEISNWVNPTELSDSKLDINSGESGKLIFKATPIDFNDARNIGSGFSTLNLTWKEELSGSIKTLYLTKNNVVDGVLNIVLDMSTAKEGKWSISFADIRDFANNWIRYDENMMLHTTAEAETDKLKAAGIDLSKLSFTVLNSNVDTIPPEISNWVNPTELSDSKLDINSGESGKLVFKASPIDLNDAGNTGSGFKTLQLTWKEELSGSMKTLYLTENNVVNGVLNIILDMSFAKAGKWSISSASMNDNADNYIVYYGSNPAIYLEKFKAAGIDLSTLSFTVENSNPDSVLPKISDWIIPSELSDAKLNINSGESGKLIFKATPIDLNDAGITGSGFSTLQLSWKEAISGGTKDIVFFNRDLIDGKLNKMLDMSFAKAGKWNIYSAYMSDVAGNSIFYYDTNHNSETVANQFKAAGIDLSTLSFSVLNASTPTYTLTPSAATINEGATLTTSVATTNVASGTTLYYTLSGTGITTADFSAGALIGEGVTDATGKFAFTHTLANDLTTEGAETLSINLYSDSARTLQVGTTVSVSIVDTSITSASFNLDVDGDGKITALGDGLMIIRKLFGAAFAGDALTNKAMSPTSTRTTAEIHEFIQQGITTGLLDVDKDGKTTALGDGLMVIRHLFGAAFANEALTNKAISPASPYFGPPINHAAVAANIDALRIL